MSELLIFFNLVYFIVFCAVFKLFVKTLHFFGPNRALIAPSPLFSLEFRMICIFYQVQIIHDGQIGDYQLHVSNDSELVLQLI